jgi:hypothetical protein
MATSMFANKLTEGSRIVPNDWGESVYNQDVNPLIELLNQMNKMDRRSFDYSRRAKEYKALLKRCWAFDAKSTLRLMFYIYDIRGGVGKRQQFRLFVEVLDELSPETLVKNLAFIPHFGRWDMMIEVWYNSKSEVVQSEVIDMYVNQIFQDRSANITNSLAAKWLPKPTNKSPMKKAFRYAFMRKFYTLPPHVPQKVFNREERRYRKMRTQLSSTVEQQMSANKWDDIKFETVPGVALNKYSKAWERHLAARWQRYLEDAASGKTTMNSGTMSMVNIYDMWRSGKRESANAAWNNRPKINVANSLPLIDISESMSMYGDALKIAMTVGVALAEAHDDDSPFKNVVGMFAERPEFLTLSGTFCDKMDQIKNARVGYTTNLNKAYEYLLNVAVQNSVPQSELPSLVLLSDMEVSMSGDGIDWFVLRRYNADHNSVSKQIETAFDKINKLFANYGYVPPFTTFWNCSPNDKMLVQSYHKNVSVVSGDSEATMNFVMEGLTPVDTLMNIVNDPRYSMLFV